ncbi:hypothetical protein ABEF95_000521 [Exophiala dermatitidis]
MSLTLPDDDSRHAPSVQRRRNNNAPERKSGPSRREWERIRPVFEKYLVEEEKTLPEVREVLSKEHGFEAQLHALKLRRDKWNLGVNFRDAQLEEAAKEAKRLSDLGHEPSEELEVNGRKIPWDRVRRRFRREKKEEWQKYNCAFLRRPLKPSSKACVRYVALGSKSLEGDVEYILFQISSYYPGCLVAGFGGPRLARSPYTGRSGVEVVGTILDDGLSLIAYGRPDLGWGRIDQACSRLKDVLCKQEVDLVPTLISMLTGTRFRAYAELYAHIVDFYASMAREVLGPKHPITAILERFTKANAELWDVSEPMYRTILDIIRRIQPVNLASDVVYSLEAEYIRRVSVQRDVTAARCIADTKWRERHETLGPNHPYTITMLHMRAMLLAEENRRLVAEAEEMAWKILRLGDQRYQSTGKCLYCVYAMQIGGKYFKDQRYSEAEECFNRSALWAASTLDESDSFHIRTRKMLEFCRKLREWGFFTSQKPEMVCGFQTQQDSAAGEGSAGGSGSGIIQLGYLDM